MKKYLVFALVLLMPFFVSAQAFERDLRFGLQGDSDVIKLQEFLADRGLYSGPITGNFFSLTLKAVKKLQTQENIKPASGYVGAKTREKLNQLFVLELKDSDQQASTESAALPVSVSITPTPTKTESAKPSALTLMINQIAALQKQLDLLLKKTPTPPVQTVTVPTQVLGTSQPTPQNIPSSQTTQPVPVTPSVQLPMISEQSPPVVSSPQQEPIESLQIKDISITTKETSAVVQWKTNKITESLVTINRIDENNVAIFVADYKSTGLSHSIEVINLRPNVKYSYSISSKSNENDSVYESARTFIIPPSSRFILNIEPTSQNSAFKVTSYVSGIPVFKTNNLIRRTSNLNATMELMNAPFGLDYSNISLNGMYFIHSGDTYNLVQNGSYFPFSSDEIVYLRGLPYESAGRYSTFQVKVTLYGAEFPIRCPEGVQYCTKSDFTYPKFPVTNTVTIDPS